MWEWGTIQWPSSLAHLPETPSHSIPSRRKGLFGPFADRGLVGSDTALKMSALLVSNVAFVLAAVALHRLSRLVLRDEPLAFLAAAVFCVTPAGIFMSAAYSER